MIVTQTRDHVHVRGLAILHTTAVRDWCCGECGANLKTRWFNEPPNWRTVCANDPAHEPDGFIHQSTRAYLVHRALDDAAKAQEVFSHLPPELQAAIQRRE